MTASEEFVARLCQRTFLSPWSTANPRGKQAGKELCDVLVVCDPDVIIISVKEIEYKETEDIRTGMDRWTSKAVNASAKQIYGAERLLRKLDRVTDKDGAGWLFLPSAERRRDHRIAVALGSKGEIPLAEGRNPKGFIHILDEQSVSTLLNELDTVTDFVDYLVRTEAFLKNTQVVVPGLENFLALYLHNGRSFPDGADLLIVHDDMWNEISARDEFNRRKEADLDSYFWDNLIEHIVHEHDPALTQSHGFVNDPNPEIEQVTRIMARENRFNRRLLARAFKEFHKGKKSRSRVVQSPSGVVYVYLATPRSQDRVLRSRELLGRMFIARGMIKTARTVIGIATEEHEESAGFSIDTAAYIKEEWTAEDQAQMEEMQRETGAFQNPTWSRYQEDEYPRSRS
jgi:hypothetical protein